MASGNLYDEKELLSQVARGNEEAFTRIFENYRQKIYALAYHLTESSIYSEEIVQDVFLKIWLKQEQLLVIENFEAYLFVSARNHIYSYLKAMSKHKIVNSELDIYIPSEEDTPETIIYHKEYAALIVAAVQQLPEQQLQVYQLSKEEGRSRGQIAALLKISPETVKVHLSRAMRSIRAYIVSRIPGSLVWFVISLVNLKK